MNQRAHGIAALLLCVMLGFAGCSGNDARKDAGQDSGLVATGQDDQGPYHGIEAFPVGDATVLAYRYEQVVGPWGRVYAFCVTPAAAPPYAIVLGSFEATTLIAREMVAIGAADRIYHLDRYDAATATTLGMFGQPPAYENVRAMVSAAVAGQPVDTTSRVALGVALAHSVVDLKAFPASAQTGGPCAAQAR